MGLKENIKKYRSENDMTLEDVAVKVGVSRQTIQKYESGVISNIPSDKIEKLAEIFHITPSELMGWEDTGESVSSIINDTLKEIGISLEEVAKKANVPLYWLQNIDTFIPGEWGGENDIAYKWISDVAEAINIPGGKLRMALARQEVPAYDGPIESVDVFLNGLDFDKKLRNEYKSVFYQQLNMLGYSINGNAAEGNLWINYPDGTLEITQDVLNDLISSSKSYLKFQLEELKQKNINDFKKK